MLVFLLDCFIDDSLSEDTAMKTSQRFSRLSFAAVTAVATSLLVAAMPAIAQDAPAAPKSGPTQDAPSGEQAPGRGGARRQGQDGGAARGPRGENPSMGGSMKAMNRALKSLKDSIEDTSKTADNLKLIGDMERGCILAKNAPMPADMLKDAKDDAAKAKVSAHFRRDMVRLAQALLQLELAIMDGKLSEAKSMLEEIEKEREHAHEEFGVKEDE